MARSNGEDIEAYMRYRGPQSLKTRVDGRVPTPVRIQNAQEAYEEYVRAMQEDILKEESDEV